MPIRCSIQNHKFAFYSKRWRCTTCCKNKAKIWRSENRGKQRQSCKEWRNSNRAHFNFLSRSYWTKTKALIWSLKSNPCIECNNWFSPWQMQFDHLPAFKKSKEVNAAWNSSDTKLFVELAKCQLVCANCHEDRSYRRRYISAS